MNFNSLNAALSQAPALAPDAQGNAGNTTTGKAVLQSNFESIIPLIVTNAVTQEVRTLKDPQNAGVLLTLVLFSTQGANLIVNAQSKINVAGNTNIQFTAVDQSVQLWSIPVAGTPEPKFRWQVVFNNGATLS